MTPLKSQTKAENTSTAPQQNDKLVTALLTWYRTNHRKLPWRAKPGGKQDPYVVWLSEIMLQQTTVPTVIPYFLKFKKRWPHFASLAKSSQAEVLSAWAGLGYYSRARNLHACAQRVANEHGGKLPSSESQLQTLPGIGPYTAAAISAIAFGNRAAPVDGNIERVLSRLRRVTEPLPTSKPHLKQLAEELAPQRHAGDFAQAMMDLGSEICTPKSPACTKCPWQHDCEAFKTGQVEGLPRRLPKTKRPTKRAATFVLLSPDDRVFIRRRPAKGLLASMHETPTSQLQTRFPTDPTTLAPVHANYRQAKAVVTHTFTHFDLELQVFVAILNDKQSRSLSGEWAKLDQLEAYALPTLFRKVIRQALEKKLKKPSRVRKARRRP